MCAQWGWHIDQEECPAMPLGERIRQLRKEAGWSQAELADKIGADAGRVNKYEAGRMAPAADTLVHLAEVLNVSIDYLLIDSIPRRPLHSAEDALGDRLIAVAELGSEDLNLVVSVIDALVAKTRMKALTANIA